jgi:hypothetical protein
MSRAGLEPERPIDESQVIDSANRQKRQNRYLSRTEVHSGYTEAFPAPQVNSGGTSAREQVQPTDGPNLAVAPCSERICLMPDNTNTGVTRPPPIPASSFTRRRCGKRGDSRYEPGQRSGAWQKMRVNQGQELVIAGYTPSDKNFDALVIGFYEDGKLIYAARTLNGFTPASRADLFKKLKPLEITECHGMPVRESAGEKGGTLGCWAHGRQDG